MPTPPMDYKKVAAEISCGSLAVENVDWSHMIVESYDMEHNPDPLPSVPFILWMLDKLTWINARDYRIKALDFIIPRLPDYLQEKHLEKKQLEYYQDELRCLLHYFVKINYIIPYFEEAGAYYVAHQNEDPVKVEMHLYYQHLGDIEDGAEYFAFAEAHSNAINLKLGEHFSPFLPALRVHRYLGRLCSENIIDFSRDLMMAETTRTKYLNDWKPTEIITPKSFPIKLRNRCFDLYISHRLSDIMTELEEDNDRLYPATELDALHELYSEDENAFGRLDGMRQFKGSAAYAQVWKPGTPHILRIAELFLKYLQNVIANKKQITSAPQTVNIQQLNLGNGHQTIQSDNSL